MTNGGGWYPVALSNGIETGTSSGTRLLGEEIVIWRDGAGAAHIWEDRCPHRGMRLSFGYVRSDRIACLYHGWQYGTDGQCLYVPAHPDLKVPPTITTWRHTCREEMGMIWGHLREASDAPAIPAEVADGTVVPVRSIHVDCSADVLADRLTASAFEPFNEALATGARRSARREGPLVVVTIANGDRSETLIGGVQPLAADRSALHLVVVASAGDYRGAGQVHFARIAEMLRSDLETGAVGVASAPTKQ